MNFLKLAGVAWAFLSLAGQITEKAILGSAFSNFLKEVVTSGLNFGESPEPDWTKEKRALFASRLRSAHVTISYAIARCVANALIYGSKTIARYPVREAVGLVVI